ncbi:MAG: YbgA family protein [Thermoleophilum sp.]|nr:YbgA family protein [Thermoleophilum sp.]
MPLEVPLALLRHHLRRHGSEWAREQVYLEPFPRDLGLRSRP